MPQTGPPDVAIFLQQEIVMTAKYPSVRRRVPASLFTLSLALAIAADPASASETADRAAAQVEGGSYGGEIVVTARRRQETAQDVPIAISVVAGEQIDNSGSFNKSEEHTSELQSLMRISYA